MSVLKSKRRPTSFLVITNFITMRKEITELIFRDFGYRPEKDENAEYHMWFAKMEHEKILKLLQDADRYIIMANSIFPAYSYEYSQRRELQNAAIGLCFDILQEFQYTIETLELDVNKFERYVGLIDSEIQLLRGWRQADNSKRKKLELNETK